LDKTDKRWQDYHKRLKAINLKSFASHPLMKRVMTLSGSDNYFQYTESYPKELIEALAHFQEHPCLLKNARPRKNKRIHISSEKYIYQVCLLRHQFNLAKKSVLEMGSGYGGFCRIVRFAEPRLGRYTLFDHPTMQRLAQFFLSTNPLLSWVSTDQTSELEQGEFDVLVSNYCLSEVPPEFRQYVYNKVFTQCKGVFIIDGGNNEDVFKDEVTSALDGLYKDVNILPYAADRNMNVWVARKLK